jgi:hypothetical protein
MIVFDYHPIIRQRTYILSRLYPIFHKSTTSEQFINLSVQCFAGSLFR